MRDEKMLWAIALLVVLAGAAAIWYFRSESPPSEPQYESRQTPEPAVKAEPARPLYPVAPVQEPDESESELRPLPPLDESDEYFKLEVVDLFGKASEKLIVSSGLIERVVATVDNLPRQQVADRIRPVTVLEGPFVADEDQDGSGQYTLSEQNYRRYDPVVEQFVNADLEDAIALYRRYYPLFQKAYVGQGYPDGYFNDRLVEVIDHLLAAPDAEGPVELTRPNVMYEFADPELEKRSAGQKLLLRLGPDNRVRVKERLKELRALIVES